MLPHLLSKKDQNLDYNIKLVAILESKDHICTPINYHFHLEINRKMKSLTFTFIYLLILQGCAPSTQENKAEAMEVNQTKSPDLMLRHVVLFKFKDGTSPVDIEKVEAAFNDLPNHIPEIKGLEWGINNSPEGLDQGFTHCFFLSFADEAGRAVYLPHPKHKEFGGILTPYLDKVLVVDYWAK